ncbi:MAG: RNA 2',3'-cyclic phosphodiesterase [Candidatus Thorarchaeota archaeon]|nr:RNA 2',3'-cyclic phosphodiesterase [Candidatus Thorarchaeota archaeon]
MNSAIRVFLSVDIDTPPLISRISEIQRKLNKEAAKMKLVEADNIHFTLRFFGDTPVTKVQEIKECLSGISIRPFDIKISGVGAFPNKRRPRVIWIGVTENSQIMTDLKLKVDELLRKIGYQPEKTKFTPHATIARIRNIKDSQLMSSNLDDLIDEPVGNMKVSKVNMKKSTLTPSGPIYETLWYIE